MFYCVSSGQAHVCDQNCAQRIFLDNHSDICRLSRRVFARSGSGGGEALMADMARWGRRELAWHNRGDSNVSIDVLAN
jgi:hypothetical protein